MKKYPSRLTGLAALTVLHFGLALAQSAAPLTDPSESDILEALGGRVGGLPSKSFRRTEAPDTKTRACPEGRPDAPAGGAGASKNLVAVPFASDGAPSVDLAINFETNSDKILGNSHAALNSLSKALNSSSLRAVNVAVAGHTDAQGKAPINLQLSCARAIAVRNYLLGQGVDSARLGVYGFGSERPLQAGMEVSAMNRRVEIRRAN
jgi:outer membrane protein OmpA-like peptidoglycan-associated protein